MFANIIVDITHEKLDRIFQYRIPSHLEGNFLLVWEYWCCSEREIVERRDM